METHCGEHNQNRAKGFTPALSWALQSLNPCDKLRHKLCPAAPQQPLGPGTSPIPPGNLQLHKTSIKILRGGTGAAALSHANEHESLP